MSEQGKPAIIQSLEKKLGLNLNPGPAPDLLVRDDYALQYALDEQNHLIGLNLAGCELKRLELGPEFHLLQVLNVGRTPLRHLQIPEELEHLRELRAYECKYLEKVDLPNTLNQLHYLDLSECALTQFQLPQGLLALKTLYLQKNKLQSLNWPESCPALLFADLSQNELHSLELPEGLKNLHYLYLNDNKLQNLQCSGTLPALQVLHLRNNQLEELPFVFVQNEGMETLYLHGNPLPGIPREHISDDERGNSFKAVRDYLIELNKGQNTINDRAKLIIVGNGRVGKTSLCKQLKGEKFDANEKFTHGIQIGQLTKKHLPEVPTPELKLNVWDFGGQEIFYATHQFFLSDEAIYLLAWTNPKNVVDYLLAAGQPKDEKWREEEYWLDNIRLHGPNSPILMVQTHCDQRENKLLPQAEYQENYQAEFLDFSANKGFGLAELKAFIQEKLEQNVPMYGQEFPQSYERVIQTIEGSKDNFISIDHFEAICRQCDITPGTESTVLAYLHKSGVVVHFDREGLKDVVFTNPNWLTQQVYRLINSELEAKAGKINRDYLVRTLPEFSPEERARFVELLKTFKLIFIEDEKQDLYIAPQYLPRVLDSATRELYESHKEELALAFVFRFPRFMPDNVMINFLSTYGPYSRKMYWRNGIFFKKNEQKCIVELDEEARALSVFCSRDSESFALQQEVCAAFVELSKKSRAEISLDGQVFASWQQLQGEFELFSHNPGQSFFAIDKKSVLKVEDFVHFFEHGEWGLRNEKRISSKEKPKLSLMDAIKDLVVAGKLSEALSELNTAAPTNFKNEVILLQARYKVLKQKETRKLLPADEAALAQEKLNEAILQLCELIESGLSSGKLADPVAVGNKPAGKKIFISYSKNDKAFLEEFLAHLSPLKRSGKISSWYDREILPGDEWDGEIKEELINADIILLMVSAYFLNTDYVWDIEIAIAMALHERSEARIIPVFMKPCKWDDAPFNKLNGLPSKGKPVSAYADRDEAWLEVVKGIERVLEK